MANVVGLRQECYLDLMKGTYNDSIALDGGSLQLTRNGSHKQRPFVEFQPYELSFFLFLFLFGSQPSILHTS